MNLIKRSIAYFMRFEIELMQNYKYLTSTGMGSFNLDKFTKCLFFAEYSDSL
jgi:hypothetical protein